MSDATLRSIAAGTWSALSDRVAQHMGIDHSKGRQDDLVARIMAATPGLGYADVDECVKNLLNTPWSSARIQKLASHLSVRETYFYRELASLRALQEQVLPALLASRRAQGRRLRVWTAGCCTGEEPYSLGILLHELLADIEGWDIEIRASDIDEQALLRARDGEYAAWSFRELPDELKTRYFTAAAGNRHRIARRVHDLVRFEYHNLADPLAFARTTASYDLILCRNVLIYFAPGTVRTVLDGLAGSLVRDGWLVVGAVELSLVDSSGLVAVAFDECVLHRRSDESGLDAGPTAALHLTTTPEVAGQRTSGRTAAPMPQRRRLPQGRISASPRPAGDSLPAAGDVAAMPSIQPTGALTPRIDAMAMRARACADAGQWADARDACLSGLRSAPEAVGLHEVLAIALRELGEIAPAIARLRRVLSLDPGNWRAHYWLGQWLGQVGRRRSAVRHLQRALALIEQLAESGRQLEGGGLSPILVVASIRATLAAHNK
jgi:chemotaxis protein methyltransferase CheR